MGSGTSYNGWPANSDKNAIGVQQFGDAKGFPFPGGVKGGDVFTVLGYVATQLHNRVEACVSGWCWGYTYKANANNPSQLSCHASGTAIDFNAPNHPNGSGGTFNSSQRGTIYAILDEVEGGVDWLEGYDEMHFEIAVSSSTLAGIASRLGGSSGPSPTPPPTSGVPPFPLPGGYYYGPKNGPEESISGMYGEPQPWIDGLVQAQQRLEYHSPGCLPLYGADGMYGEDMSGETHDATLAFQQRNGNLECDALIGPATWTALWTGVG